MNKIFIAAILLIFVETVRQRLEYGEANWILVWLTIFGFIWVVLKISHWNEQRKKFKKF